MAASTVALHAVERGSRLTHYRRRVARHPHRELALGIRDDTQTLGEIFPRPRRSC